MNERSAAYHTGYEAYNQGQAYNTNPYPDGSFDADEWDSGWRDADADENN